MTHEELYDDELMQYGGLEFPQINYDKHNGRPYRYFYSCGFGHVFSDSLLKMDVQTKELKVLNQSNNRRECLLLSRLEGEREISNIPVVLGDNGLEYGVVT